MQKMDMGTFKNGKPRKSNGRMAWIQPNGYLKLLTVGRPKSERKYVQVTGDKLKNLLDGRAVKA